MAHREAMLLTIVLFSAPAACLHATVAPRFAYRAPAVSVRMEAAFTFDAFEASVFASGQTALAKLGVTISGGAACHASARHADGMSDQHLAQHTCYFHSLESGLLAVNEQWLQSKPIK